MKADTEFMIGLGLGVWGLEAIDLGSGRGRVYSSLVYSF